MASNALRPKPKPKPKTEQSPDAPQSSVARNLKEAIKGQSLAPVSDVNKVLPQAPQAPKSAESANIIKEPGLEKVPVFKDAETGNLSGFTDDKGNTFLGVPPEDVQRYVNKQQAKKQIPEGGALQGQEAAEQELRRQGLQLAQQVGDTEPQQLEGNFKPNYLQALGVGVAAAAPGAIGGALVGGASTLGVGAPVVAGIGAVGGFLAGFRTNLKSQMNEEIGIAGSLQQRQKYLRTLVTDTNRNPQNAAENLQIFNEQLEAIERDQLRLEYIANHDLSNFLGTDARKELSRYETFQKPLEGQKDYLIRAMQQALVNPDPTKSELTLEDYGVDNVQ